MLQPIASTSRSAAQLLDQLDARLAARYPAHPFAAGLDAANFEAVMGDYVAMSVAFPYIQAGAAYEAYKRSVEAHGTPDANARITAAIGAFLAWDEFGGHELVLRHGAQGLLQLTRTDANFHSALLLSDIEALTGRPMPSARPSPVTRVYLERLHLGLSDPDEHRNVAHMVAFEKHAMAMITALWAGIAALFDVAGDTARFGYFQAHIGTDTAGEAVHVQMTESMVAELVPEADADRFLDLCVEAYGLNFQWCADVIAGANGVPRAALVA